MVYPAPDGFVDVDVYLQVEPRRRQGSVQGRPGKVVEAAVVATTQSRPRKPRGGTITTRITLRIPQRAFDPLEPEAVIVIPMDMTEPHRIEVVATDPAE